MNSTEILNTRNDPILSRLIDVLAQATDPDQLILFGSRAEGSANADRAYRVLFDAAFPKPVDTVVAESDHFANASWGILSEVRHKGISIYERA